MCLYMMNKLELTSLCDPGIFLEILFRTQSGVGILVDAAVSTNLKFQNIVTSVGDPQAVIELFVAKK